MTKFCSECGKPLMEDSAFCSNCGARKGEIVSNIKKEKPKNYILPIGIGLVALIIIILGAAALNQSDNEFIGASNYEEFDFGTFTMEVYKGDYFIVTDTSTIGDTWRNGRDTIDVYQFILPRVEADAAKETYLHDIKIKGFREISTDVPGATMITDSDSYGTFYSIIFDTPNGFISIGTYDDKEILEHMASTYRSN